MPPVPALVCVGNITIDDAVLPDGRRQDMCLGGDALYAALAARLFERDVAMLTAIGAGLPPAAATAMARAGFPPDAQPQRNAPTIRNMVAYDDSGGRDWTLLTDPRDFDALSIYPDDVLEEHAAAAAFMVAAMSLESQARLTPWLRESTEATIYLDVQEDYIPGNEERVLRFVSSSHVFLPSEEEVRRLLHTEDWEKAARMLSATGPETVVIKRAALGSLVYESATDQMVEVPAYPADVVDSTGAGDAFCGAFAAVHQQTGDAVRAARAGAVAAAVGISGYGTSALLAASASGAARRLSAWR